MKNTKFAALGDYARVDLGCHKVNGRADRYQTAAEVTMPEDKVIESQRRCYNTNTKLLTQPVISLQTTMNWDCERKTS